MNEWQTNPVEMQFLQTLDSIIETLTDRYEGRMFSHDELIEHCEYELELDDTLTEWMWT